MRTSSVSTNVVGFRLFSFDPCLFLSLTLHLQMGDESEPVTAQRERANLKQFTFDHFNLPDPSVLDFFPQSFHL